MGIFDFFRGREQGNDVPDVGSLEEVENGMSLAECVELMFRNAGIRPHVDGNKYLTEVQARHCVFTPVLVAEGNRLIIMVRFPAPVLEQFAYSVNDEIVQRAYNVADETERDLLRKLRYLGKAKATDHDDDNDFMIGRLEALGMIQGNPWALLSGTD